MLLFWGFVSCFLIYKYKQLFLWGFIVEKSLYLKFKYSDDIWSNIDKFSFAVDYSLKSSDMNSYEIGEVK